MDTVGKRISYIREDSDISQKQLAKMVGITEASMSRYENDIREPKAMIVARIADALGVSTDYLLGREEMKKENDSVYPISLGEKQLLKKYRSLTAKNRVRIKERIDIMIELQKNEK